MSTDTDFSYNSEKVTKDGHDYEISLLSPDDFEIIRARCDIPSPLHCALEDGVSRQLSNPLNEPTTSKCRQRADEPNSSCDSGLDKGVLNVGEGTLPSRYDHPVAGDRLETNKVVRPVPSYSFPVKRKEVAFETCSNPQESLSVTFVGSPTKNRSLPSDRSSDPKENNIKNCFLSNTSKQQSEGQTLRPFKNSGHHQNALVIVTPPGFKVGDSLPAVKSANGPHTAIFYNSTSCKGPSQISKGTLANATLHGSGTLDTTIGQYRKLEPLYDRNCQNDKGLLESKYKNDSNSELVTGSNTVGSDSLSVPIQSKGDRCNYIKERETDQSVIWKSGLLLSRNSSHTETSNDRKSAPGDGQDYQGREIPCLSTGNCYGVNVVIDDTGDNVSQFQNTECSQHNVAILEGYEQSLAVSGGLLNNTTVSEQTFLHITSMNNESDDNTPNDRMPGEVVITQHLLSLPQLYSCHWEGCNTHLLSIEDLISHAVSAHVKPGKDQQYCCLWQGCQRDGRTFNARYKMLIHLRTHTGEKPHVCPMEGCGKSFSRMENLKIHMRCHTGERPYKCPYEGCGKSYSNSSDRFKHTKTHYEKKPYRCKYEGCQKSYTDPSSLRKHHKSHRTKVALSLYVQSSTSTV